MDTPSTRSLVALVRSRVRSKGAANERNGVRGRRLGRGHVGAVLKVVQRRLAVLPQVQRGRRRARAGRGRWSVGECRQVTGEAVPGGPRHRGWKRCACCGGRRPRRPVQAGGRQTARSATHQDGHFSPSRRDRIGRRTSRRGRRAPDRPDGTRRKGRQRRAATAGPLDRQIQRRGATSRARAVEAASPSAARAHARPAAP